MKSGLITVMACAFLLGALGCETLTTPYRRPVHLYPLPKRPVEELAYVELEKHGNGGISGNWIVVLRGVDGHPAPESARVPFVETVAFYVPAGGHVLHIRTQSDSSRRFDYDGQLRIEFQAGQKYLVKFRGSSADPRLEVTAIR